MTSLWKNDGYNAPVDHLFDKVIVEYDMEHANASFLFSEGIIDKPTFIELLIADKQLREVTIGMMFRDDPSLNERYANWLANKRRELCEAVNCTEDHQILHVVKDAIWMVAGNSICGGIKLPKRILLGEHCAFKRSIEYGYYARLNPALCVYYPRIPAIEEGSPKRNLYVRGMSNEALALHSGEHGFVNILESIFFNYSRGGPDTAYQMVKQYYNIFDDPNCPPETKRRFDAESAYDIKVDGQLVWSRCFRADYLSENMKDMVDGSFNQYIIAAIGIMLLADRMHQLRP